MGAQRRGIVNWEAKCDFMKEMISKVTLNY